MLRFAANISLLFKEIPYLDRFQAAADNGFFAVEILFPYEFAAKETRWALIANGLELVLINAPPPNYAGGTPGFAALPEGIDRFQRDIRRALRFADELKAGQIHVMAGETDAPSAKATMIANLQWAADHAPKHRFTIEPLNPADKPGYFLNNYDLAAEILDAVERPNVALQFDSYHAQVIHGDAVAVWEQHKRRVSHIQIGDAPGRTEPGRGGVDFATLLASIDASGYDGWVSAEYNPTTTRTEDSLSWHADFA